MRVLVREYRDDDLDQVLHLLDGTTSQRSVFRFSECIGALRSDSPAVVAVLHGYVVGVGIAAIAEDRAWVMRLAIDPHRRGEGLASTLLSGLERLLVARHVRRIGYVLPEEELLADGLAKVGYTRHPAVAYFEKVELVGPGEGPVLNALGGSVLAEDIWAGIAGMRREKAIIERRIILPLAHRERAAAHGVSPPRAIVLFGPPGTGKTTFARGVASRLGWPFVEIVSPALASGTDSLERLRLTFRQLDELERVVVLIDEVDEVASTRSRGDSAALTNELLKVIPQFRQRDTRLLIATTNAIRALDPAFIRPGRFDYIIPVGLPDAEAREALWRGHATNPDVDIAALVDRSAGLTPADINHAAGSAAQESFERDIDYPTEGARRGATTEDYLAAVAQTRPTVAQDDMQQFADDVGSYERL